MNTTAPALQPRPGGMPGLAPGGWRVDPAHSHASFAARVAGRPVRGRLPMTGSVLIGEPIEDSAARLAATDERGQHRVAVLDRLLTSPAFLDAEAFPEITFSSELLVWVPAGWRAVGRLQVKGTEHELACQLSLQFGDARRADAAAHRDRQYLGDRLTVGDQPADPGLGRRIVMTCSLSLEPDM